MKIKLFSKLWKTGNSYVITIPLQFMKNTSLKKGDILDIDLNIDDGEREQIRAIIKVDKKDEKE